MRASGTYNPVTQSAGGAVEVSRGDYQERRTDWAFWLVALAAVVVGAWLLITLAAKTAASAVPDAISSVISGATDAATSVVNGGVAAVRETQQRSVDTVVKAAGMTPSAETTDLYWKAADRWLGGGAFTQTAIAAGNTALSMPVVDILGKPLLQRAVGQGQAFGAELAANGDVQRLQNDPLKSLIISGEALSTTFTGFDPYVAGVATGGWIRSVLAK